MKHNREYEVGYKKPPVEKRWKAGQSGNPAGRPKGRKPKIVAQLLLEALRTPVTITDERGHRTVTAREALVDRLFHDALHGDSLAAKQLDVLLQKSEQTAPPPDRKEVVLVFANKGDVIVQGDERWVVGGPTDLKASEET